MIMTDKKRTIDVKMLYRWEGETDPREWSNEFFEVGSFGIVNDPADFADYTGYYSQDADLYIVQDLDYCIEQARDWLLVQGDQDGAEYRPGEERWVKIFELGPGVVTDASSRPSVPEISWYADAEAGKE